MRRAHLFALAAVAATCFAVSGCGAPKIVQAPTEMAGMTVFVAQPQLTGDGAGECGDLIPALQAATQASLLKAGFRVVSDPSAPHDAEAKTTAEVITHGIWPMKTYETNGKLMLEQGGTLIDQVEGDSSQDKACTGFEDIIAAEFANALVASERVAQFARTKTATPGAGGPAVASTPPAGGATPPAATASGFVHGTPQPTTWALVIGIEKYRDVPPPAGARQDAEQFAQMLRETAGIRDEQLRVILDDRATRSDIDKELAWLEKNVPEGARIAFYFSGHGAPDAASGTPYLLPYDGDPKYVDRTAIQLSQVIDQLGKTKAREAMVFLDSCFSGSGGRSVLPPGTRPLVRVKQLAPGPKVSVLSASSGAEISGQAPGGTGGLFTQQLLDAIGNARADGDGDGQITLKEIADFVGPRVKREARKDNRDQTPTLTAAGDPSNTVVVYGVQAK
jgi:Caspase domain